MLLTFIADAASLLDSPLSPPLLIPPPRLLATLCAASLLPPFFAEICRSLSRHRITLMLSLHADDFICLHAVCVFFTVLLADVFALRFADIALRH